MENLPGMKIDIPDFAVIDIKYDGPSFEGVMDISSLGNELLGLEYCIREVFKKLKASDANFSEILDSDLVILVEPFQNNCFRKKIRISAIRKEINKLTLKEIGIVVPLGCAIIALIPSTISGLYTVITDLIPDEVQQITETNISPELVSKIGNQIKAELIADPKFRRELGKIAIPLSNSNDISEIRTTSIEGQEQLVVINQKNKDNFFAIGGYERIMKEEIMCHEKRENLYGRINAIDVDATKRQIGFKLEGEGKEIDCHLNLGLNINNYKHLLGRWVTIEGVSTYSGINPEKIEIEKIIESEPPLREYSTASMNF